MNQNGWNCHGNYKLQGCKQLPWYKSGCMIIHLGSLIELLYGLAFLDCTFLGFLPTLYRSRLLIVYRQQAIVAVSAKKR